MLQVIRDNGNKVYGVSLLIFLAWLISTPLAFGAPKLSLVTSGGITVSGARPAYSGSFGTMNALAIGATSVTIPAGGQLTNGAVYYSTLKVSIAGFGGNTGVVKAYVSTPFSGGAASAMVMYACAAPAACNSTGQYSVLSTSAAAETTLTPTLNSATPSAIVGIGIFLPDNDGATAFTGLSALGATVTFDLFVNGSTTATDTDTLALTNETVQDAVQLLLSGAAITPGSDYSLSFGSVNALGIGSTFSTSPQAGGIIYQTPYNLLPAFGDLAKTTATINVCVSKPFTNPSQLVLEKSATGSSGSFTNITKCTSGSDTLTATAGDRSSTPEYLGLFVASMNGPSVVLGLDTATLTYTLTVP